MKKLSALLLVACVFGATAFAEGQAEDDAVYPNRPIDIIVPFGPGGGTDTVARIVVEGLTEYLPEPVSVVNIGGAASAVGTQEAYQADPDGYTLLFTLDAIFTNEATGASDVTVADFVPIAQAGSFAPSFVTRYDSPYDNLREVIEADLARGPGSIPVATNIGAIAHFQILGIRAALDEPELFRLVHIGDGASRISQTLGGHVEFTTMGAHEARNYVESQEMRILALMSEEPVDFLPDVPTANSLDIDWSWRNEYMVLAPQGTPPEVIEVLADAFESAMTDPDVIQNFNQLGLEPVFMRGEEFAQKIERKRQQILDLGAQFEFQQ